VIVHYPGMNRRRFLLTSMAGALVTPRAVGAQQAVKVPRVGVLSPGNPPPGDAFHQRDRFEAGLRELGWKPGSTIVVDYRYAEGKLERLPALAAELVGIPVDVIVARGLTIAAARQATAKIPIVMAADPDPVRSGFVASLARPGGNITGFSTQALDSEPKQLEFLREALPSLVRVAVLTNGNSPDREDMKRIDTAARTLRLELTEFPISGSEQLASAFPMMTKARAGAVLVSPTLWFINANQLAALALKHRHATIHNLRQFAEAGVLISYGANFAEIHRRSAVFVNKLLKGANPAELSVEQPTTFELVINLKTAKALGLTIPQSLLLRADQVIE
jgi:putative tryptophan/tyrosine transport system substrate-binding protein